MMHSKSGYIKMLDPTQHQQTMRFTLNAFSPLTQLAKPNRQLFSQYCLRENKSRPLYAVMEYLEKYGASEVGIVVGSRIKKFILEKVRPNDQKETLLNSIGQAFLDVCLAISIADYCHVDTGKDLSPAEYLSLSLESVEYCFDNIRPFQQLTSSPVINGYENVLTGLIDMAKDIEQSKKVAITRIETAFHILDLWNKKQIPFNIEYEEIKGKIEELNSRKDNKISVLEDEVEFSELILKAYSYEDFDVNIPECEKIQSRLIELKQKHGFNLQEVKQGLGL